VLEHGGWVLFEDLVLFVACRRALADLRRDVMREEQLERLNATLEQQVEARTGELVASNRELQQSHAELRGAQDQLALASRRAGMAEIATTVLHNIGNVLNSVNVSAGLLGDTLRKSVTTRVADLHRLLERHAADLPGTSRASSPRSRARRAGARPSSRCASPR
jgi:C4-dicarboxylate-specific signal transduction histidine kinase